MKPADCPRHTRFRHEEGQGARRPKILVVDDDELLRAVARSSLEHEHLDVLEAASGEEAVDVFRSDSPDLVLLDVGLPGIDGFAACSEMRSHRAGKDLPIVILTSLYDTSDIERAYQVGATDFVTKPVSWVILNQRVKYMLRASELARQESQRRELEERSLRLEVDRLRQAIQETRLVFRSPEMEAILTTLRQAAPTDVTVLITGESGTGKELFARTLHELSTRKGKPLVTVDCSAIAPTLIESELFGHEKGAFTGACSRRKGHLAEASGGTVFLDEVGELPLEAQSRLLRFTQEQEFTPVGGIAAQKADVRIVAATNRDLLKEVEQGRFREDLYYRLNVVRLGIPPLRSRSDDVILLARHFVRLFSLRYQKPIRGLTPQAEARLLTYDWPGNVRELENRILQAVILVEGEEITQQDLGFECADEQTSHLPPDFSRSRKEVAVTKSSALPADRLDEIGRLMEAVLRRLPDDEPRPLGQWLVDDLLIAADRHSNKVFRRGAERLGIPETTFRRRLTKAKRRHEEGSSTRPADWERVRAKLDQLTERGSGCNLPEELERVLLEKIVRYHPDDTSRGSKLLGTSAPTYRRRVAALACAPRI